MRADPLGENAYILRDLGAPAHLVAQWLNAERPEGVIEAIASYDSVGLFTQRDFDLASLQLPEGFPEGEPRIHLIPVCYELGEDLEETAKRLGMTPDQLAACHASRDYTCFAVGFCPGFGYLGYLPEAMQGIPRRKSPRTRVEAGSVGITGKQTAVYPLPRPGGWALIGRTPLTLVDVADQYFPIQAGDTIRFERIGLEDFRSLEGEWL
ncbi:MAG TPA: carboxyltransferase domain-containing protein [Fimbriimonadaceae bacterium]|nr:carboxyltransferase domain-containing protein [Fimbriimonadaceae bacterium]